MRILVDITRTVHHTDGNTISLKRAKKVFRLVPLYYRPQFIIEYLSVLDPQCVCFEPGIGRQRRQPQRFTQAPVHIRRGRGKSKPFLVFSLINVVGSDEGVDIRSEEHTSELQSLMRISYAVFCLKHKNKHNMLNQ